MALPNMTEISTAIRGLMPQLRPTPVGSIGYFNDIPDGWLLCNGAAVSRTTYSKLFNIIGTRYGAGDGSTTFNLPNLDGRFLESTTDVSKLGQYVEAGLPDITGWQGGAGISTVGKDGIPYSGALSSESNQDHTNKEIDLVDSDFLNVTSNIWFQAQRSNSIYGNSNTVQTNSLRLMPCIHT